MRQVGENQFEIVNKKTGAKKIVSGEDLGKYGLTKPNESESSLGAKVQQGIYKIPIIGDIAQVIGASTGGIAAAIKTPQVEKQTMADQEKARQLAIAARIELDPDKKKELLDRSRALSQGAGERASKYSETVDSVLPAWAKNKESPTKNNVKEMLTAYGIPSARAGLAAGELMMLLGGGVPKMGPQGAGFLKSLGRIGIKTAAGSALGGTQGFLADDDKTTEERLANAKTGAEIGAVLSFIGSAGGETINALKNLNKTKVVADTINKTGEISKKFSAKTRIADKVTSLASKDTSVFNSSELKKQMEEQIMKNYTGQTQKNLLKKLAEEPEAQQWTMDKIISVKRNVPFNAMAKTSEKVFNNIKKRVLSTAIHTANPTIGDLDAIYSTLSNKALGKFIKKLGTGVVIGAGAKLGLNSLQP